MTSWMSSSSVLSTSKPMGNNNSRISADVNSRPSNRLIRDVLTETGPVSCRAPWTSRTSPTISMSPDEISLSKKQNRSTAFTFSRQSVPRSNRAEASDLSPRRCEVLAIDSDSQLAKVSCVQSVLADLDWIFGDREGRSGPIDANSLRFAQIKACG